jgi:hypothetical protein
VEAELFHAHGRTDKRDMTKITVAFRNFAKAPKQRDGIFPNVETAGKIK